ncbi:hypothetical protein Hamer_G024494 [Homarus americanus]|uniref:HAT C-terminal dimerisation domain-containing protein n=1 Tax=Homarus americanus TaxID=6706 RepID=A0A8J5KD36_HOMAM|nr:hypothetical protein Hamer_G024494 [Homarus americanus]
MRNMQCCALARHQWTVATFVNAGLDAIIFGQVALRVAQLTFHLAERQRQFVHQLQNFIFQVRFSITLLDLVIMTTEKFCVPPTQLSTNDFQVRKGHQPVVQVGGESMHKSESSSSSEGDDKGHDVEDQLFQALSETRPHSAAVERMFSMGKDILRPKRSRMSDKHFEMLVFLWGNNTGNMLVVMKWLLQAMCPPTRVPH